MSTNTSDLSTRIVKTPLPVTLIRRVDQAVVSGVGGFGTRSELIQEAITNLLNELEFPEAPEPGAALRTQHDRAVHTDSTIDAASTLLAALFADIPAWEREELTLRDLAGTALQAPASPPRLVLNGTAEVRDEPLLGLHNRDYVSLWALHRLARYTHNGLIAFEDFLHRATRAAWYAGQQLAQIEDRDGHRKLTVLFPTNFSKRPSAERGFQHFAIGVLSENKKKKPSVGSGPLFGWKAIQVSDAADGSIGITTKGWELLAALDGLSLDLPHGEHLMRSFMAFLAEQAPADRSGFDYLLDAVSDGVDRETLVAKFGALNDRWSEATASSVAQGYVARAREWGLLEPRLVEGRYWLTATGRAFLDDIQ